MAASAACISSSLGDPSFGRKSAPGSEPSSVSQRPEGAWNAHWISLSYDPREDLGVFGFRKRVELVSARGSAKVRVSADQRYKLYVNGQFVGFGPQRGDELHWFYETYDLAPFLKAGPNWVAALVWNFGRWAPMAQHTARAGFVLEGLPGQEGGAEAAALSTNESWQVARLSNWSFDMMHSEDMNFYIDIGPGEIVDFRGAPWGWRTGEDEKGLADWRKPNLVCRAEERGTMGGMTPWALIPRSLPPMLYDERPQPPVVRRGFLGDSDAPGTPDKSDLAEEMLLEVGRKYLFDYGELMTAYPRLTLSGPPGTVVVLSFAEGMWQDKGGKGNRNEVAGKKMSGYQDKIVLDGQKRTIEPLWWRTYRYLMVECFPPNAGPTKTESTPAILHRLSAIETGYPLPEESSFEADDPWAKSIWDVSMRTARRCAGETYFDCPYYEQLQYVGDTRIQALIGYYLGRDRALQRNAIETLGWSLMDNGLTQSRYPSRQPQIIPPFSLWWVMMLWDQLLYDDPAARPDFVSFQTLNRILGRFRKLQKETKQFWQFGDWVPGWGWGVPPGGANAHMHQLTLELATTASERIKGFLEVGEAKQRDPRFWTTWATTQWGELADSKRPGVDAMSSEHAEALARVQLMMYDQEPPPWPAEALAKANAAKCTYYFSYYKHLAMFGRGDVDRTYRSDRTYKKGEEPQTFDYMEELAPWKEQIENGLSTFAENPEPTRSDCHAWSAHPILGFFQIVAGVTSVAPGWKKARVDPRPGSLRRFYASIAHPDGELSVKFEGGKLTVDCPVPFELRWKGKRAELPPGRHEA
jgi:alpha-L-rhamnosidase